MPQVFHPSMNTVSRVTIFGAVLFVAAAVAVAAIIVRSPYATEAGVVRVQPVPFSHQHHVGDAGIDCRYCHRTVETEAFAGLPEAEVCMDCHFQLFSDSPILAPVREAYNDGSPLRWSRVHDVPDFAYFHHGIHVQKGIACQTCHGPVDKMPLMYREVTLHMQWCLDCHRNPEDYVRPREAVYEFDWEPPSDQAALGSKLVKAHSINRKTNCSVCHR